MLNCMSRLLTSLITAAEEFRFFDEAFMSMLPLFLPPWTITRHFDCSFYRKLLCNDINSSCSTCSI